MSPPEIIYGRQLRDSFAFLNKLDKFSNPNVRPMWRKAWKLKEEALRTRFVKNSESFNQRARDSRPLYVGSRCLLQNQSGTHPRKWDRSGVVMEVLPHDQFVVQIDGTRRLTPRNRKFLRISNPASTSVEAKASHGWRGNLPSSQECNVGNQGPDSSVKITEDSNGANIGKTSDVEADHEEVEKEYIPALVVPIKNKVPLALRRLKDFYAPGKFESGVIQSRNHCKWSLFLPVYTIVGAECSIAAVSDNCWARKDSAWNCMNLNCLGFICSTFYCSFVFL